MPIGNLVSYAVHVPYMSPILALHSLFPMAIYVWDGWLNFFSERLARYSTESTL